MLVARDWKTCDCCGTPKDRPKAMTGQSHLVLQVRSSYNQESMSFVYPSGGKSLFWRPRGVSNRAKIASGNVWGCYVLLNMASGRFLTRLGSSYHSFLTALGGAKEAPRRPKSIKNQCWWLLRMNNVKMLIFDTPPLQNHYFWGPVKAKTARQSGLGTIFWAIDIDDTW